MGVNLSEVMQLQHKKNDKWYSDIYCGRNVSGNNEALYKYSPLQMEMYRGCVVLIHLFIVIFQIFAFQVEDPPLSFLLNLNIWNTDSRYIYWTSVTMYFIILLFASIWICLFIFLYFRMKSCPPSVFTAIKNSPITKLSNFQIDLRVKSDSSSGTGGLAGKNKLINFYNVCQKVLI